MFKNYIKIAFRNLWKNKVFSFINIFGLSVGLTCCMLISFYIYNEFSYDTYHKDGDRVYQLGAAFDSDGKQERRGSTSAPTGRAMQREFPEIKEQARLMELFSDDKTLLQYTDPSGNTKSFYETKGYVIDSNFFKILTYNFIEGNLGTALVEPNTTVVSEEIAQKFFGKESAVNKTIRISSSSNGDHDFRVTGVFKPFKTPSHMDARFFMSIKGGRLDEMANDNPSMLYNNMFFTYFLIKEGADAKQLEKKFPAFVQRHIGKELRAAGMSRTHFLVPIKDVHLRSGIEENVTPGGSLTSLFILGSIAMLTLLIACINFMNLSTANSAKRASEVGVRKVLGAQKSSLLRQFLGESVVMSFIALVFAFMLTLLLLPLFQQVAGKNLSVSVSQHTTLLGAFVLITFIAGLFAGSYPALYLSSFKPIQVLKGKFKNSLAAVSLRKGMVVFQFVISIALIVASVVIADQMKFLRTKDLGFVKEQQIIVPLRTSTAKNIYPALKNEVARNPDINSVGASLYYPGIFNPTDWLLHREGQSINNSQRVYMNFGDYNFLQTLNVKPVAGRLFSPDFPADTNSRMIVNEEAIAKWGFSSPQDAIGKWVGFEWEGELNKFTIIGVVKNFHFKDLHEAIEPYGFLLSNRNNHNYFIAHAKGGDIGNTLQSLQTTWKKLNPNEPFEFSFLDQDFQKNYEAESRQASLINYFTIIAIIISCLGLFGLATFSAEQRTKEIGIRKVLGASVSGLMTLLSKDFLKLVAIAVLIASPIAWYFMNKWLQNFAYRTTISWKVFAITTVLAVIIALVTISSQAIRAALANPVKNLRTE